MKQDIVTQLFAFIESRKNDAFLWGSRDCATLATDWILERTGIDPIIGIRGTYNSALSAARVFGGPDGFDAFACSLAEKSGLEEVDPKFAQRGYACLVENGKRHALGIILGAQVAAQGEHGIEIISASHVLRAWRVE